MIEKDEKSIEPGDQHRRRGATFETKVKRFKNTPLYRTSGNVTMSTSGTIYEIPNPFGAKQVMFFGIASNGGTVRVDCFGVAQLAPSYYFTPQTTSSVGLAGPRQKLIQSGKWFLVTTGAAPQYRARSIETTLVNIDWPTADDIVARAEIIDYDSDKFYVQVDLASGWQIDGNFVCT